VRKTQLTDLWGTARPCRFHTKNEKHVATLEKLRSS
jgi:hypothetical protein